MARIVVGITGGIAAYKAVGVARLLVRAGHEVHIVPTAAALRFVGRPTLEAISRNPVHDSLYDGVAEVRHVALGQRAELIVIAPATANSLAKLAHGLADDLLGTTVLASRAPLVVAPAMHSEMWEQASTRANVALLAERGVTVVGPAVGELTGKDAGVGRMAEPEQIVAAALALLPDGGAVPSGDLAGLRLLVSAGGTREALDPVRFLGNRSSGRQGVAIAEAARDRGAEVTLLAANLEVDPPEGVAVVPVVSASDLAEAATRAATEADVIVMAAAVADYRPAAVAESKIKKEQRGERLTLELVQNPDILHDLATRRRRPEQLVVGFAAETAPDESALIELGRAKIARKGADLLVLNAVGWQDGFAQEQNTVVIVDSAGAIVGRAQGAKRSVADAILDAIIARAGGSSG